MRAAITNTAYRMGDALGNRFLMPPNGSKRYFVHHGPRTARRVALTFDDGPSRGSTEELLDALGELAVPATFFCVGANVRANPDIVQRAIREGHDVGNHSSCHSRGAGLSVSDTAHILEAEHEIVAAVGRAPALYRPPWGWLTPWEGKRLSSLGYTTIGWDVYTIDWKLPEPDAEEIAVAARRDTQAGSIYAFHDAFPLRDEWEKRVTVEAVRLLVPWLQEDGYELVTVSDLLGISPWRSGSTS